MREKRMELLEVFKNQDVDGLKELIERGKDISNIRLLAILEIHSQQKYNFKFLKLLIENGVDIDSSGSVEDTKYMFSVIEKSLKDNKKLWNEPQPNSFLFKKNFLYQMKINRRYSLSDNAYMTWFTLIKALGRLGQEMLGDNISLVEDTNLHPYDLPPLSLKELKEEYIKSEVYPRYSTLMFAVEKKNIELVKFLLENGADVNLYDCNFFFTPLEYAIRIKEIALIKLLVINGTYINRTARNQTTPLEFAIEMDLDIETIEFMIKNGASVDDDFNSNQPRYPGKEFKAFDTLNDNSVYNEECRSSHINTILIRAVKNYNYKLVQLLIKNHIFVDAKNGYGDTALIVSSILGYYDIAKLLVDAGASIEIENSNGLNAIDVAKDRIKEMLFQKVASSFKNKPKDIKIKKMTKGRYYSNDLMIACENADIDKIKSLVEKNVDINIKDDKGYTALDYASFSNKFGEIRKILMNQKSKHNPKSLIKILNLFTKDNPIKYTSHSFEWSKYGSYQNFIDEVKKEFNLIDDKLRWLSINLHSKIDIFLMNDFLSNDNTWGKYKIGFGWSSYALEKWCEIEEKQNNAKKAIYFPLPKEYQYEIGGKTLTTFDDICTVFKDEIEIRDNDKLNSIFEKIEEEVLGFDFEVEYINIENITFYTDVEYFENAVTKIFEQFKERAEHDSIVIEADNQESYVDIIIEQRASTVNKNSEEMKKEIDNGDFEDIKKYLFSLCDWSIEAEFLDGNFRIEYLSENQAVKVLELKEKPQGFRHILRFYK